MSRTPQRHLVELLAEIRRLTRRARRRLDPNALAEVKAFEGEARAALAAGVVTRIRAATEALDSIFDLHLARHRKSRVREAFEVALLALVLGLGVRFLVVETFRIPTGSMAPSLLPGDVVLVSRSSYGVSLPFIGRVGAGLSPERGDVIVFESPQEPGNDRIKRVAGIEGDTVEIVDEEVRINGVPQPRQQAAERYDFINFRDDLAYWHPQTGALYVEDLGGRRHATIHSRHLPRPRPSEGPFVVPPGHVFVLGDNRDDSEDGRADGGWYVPIDSVKGRAVAVGFSWGPGGIGPGASGLRIDRLLRPIDFGLGPPNLPLQEAAAELGRETTDAVPEAEPATQAEADAP